MPPHITSAYSCDVRRGGKACGLPCGSGGAFNALQQHLEPFGWRWNCGARVQRPHHRRGHYFHATPTPSTSAAPACTRRKPGTCVCRQPVSNAATCHLLAMRKLAEARSRTWLTTTAAQRTTLLFDCTFCDFFFTSVTLSRFSTLAFLIRSGIVSRVASQGLSIALVQPAPGHARPQHLSEARPLPSPPNTLIPPRRCRRSRFRRRTRRPRHRCPCHRRRARRA